MAGHLLGDFELAAVLEVGSDAGGAEGVVADFRRNAGSDGAPSDHLVNLGLRNRLADGELAMPHGGEEGSGGLASEA